MSWPPTLADLKADVRATDDDRDDDALGVRLAAAIAYVEDVHASDPEFLESDRARLGCLMLAVRLYRRRDTPDGLLMAGELGAVRVGTGDPDIDRMLKIGRYRRSVIA